MGEGTRHGSKSRRGGGATAEDAHSKTTAPPASRPTVRPEFDPQTLALDSEVRERAETITDEVELERARVKSIPSAPPTARYSDAPDAYTDIASEESDLDDLSEEEQIAVLRSALAPLGRVPILAKSLADLGDLVADPKTAYVLGFVDGLLPLETILEVTGLPERDTLEILDRMIDREVVVFRHES